jgi:hypothetical protein
VITSRYYPKCTLCKSYHHEWNDSNAVATDAQEPEEEADDKEPTSVISIVVGAQEQPKEEEEEIVVPNG